MSAMAVGKLIGVLVLLQCPAGLMGAKMRSSIIGGNDAPKGRWPGLVYLDIVKDDGKRTWHCSGTILNEKWVLTAGRCWEGELWSRWDRTAVWLGTHAVKMPSERYMFVDRIFHPNDFTYDGTVARNDIALIMLKKSIDFSTTVAPVNFPSEDDTFNSSSECWIAGWWDLDYNTPLPDPEVKQEMRVRIVPQKRCKATFPDLNDKMLCVGGPAGGNTACEHPPHDYGSPLMCRTARGFVQVGIMSFEIGDDCHTPDRLGVYTRVSSYMEYIKAYINLHR